MKILTYLFVMNSIFWSSILFSQKNSSTWQIQSLETNEYFIIDLIIKDNHFHGTTRKKAVPQILGIGKYHLGTILNKIPKHIVAIDGEITSQKDTLYLSGSYTSFWSKQKFEATLFEDSLIGYTLKEKEGGEVVIHPIQGYRKDVSSPVRDYITITQKAISITEENVFLPHIKENKKWQKFKKEVLYLVPKIRDDYEFWLCYNYAGSKLPFSHYGVMFQNPNASQSNDVTKKQHVEYDIINKDVGLLSVHSFTGDGSEMIQSLEEIKAHQPKNLIIDLRNNGGGSIQAAMPLAQFLTRDTVYGGVFITQKWFTKHTGLPVVEDYKDLPHFTAASYSLIIKGIHEEEGLCLRIDPGETTFDGHLYVLINNHTASTCEPIVYSLKINNAATIVGEKTAGEMLNGESFAINSELSLFVPTADFYAADGYKIDGKGVLPDIKIASEEALDFVLNMISNAID